MKLSSSRPHAPSITRRTARATLAFSLIVTLAGTTTACELRVGRGAPATLPSVSAAEATRDALARSSVLIGQTAQVVADSTTEPAAVVAQAAALTAASDEYTTALGGVWQPWPSPAPTHLPTAAPVPTADPQADGADLLAVLEQGAEQAREAAITTEQGETAQLYASVAVAWSHAASSLATAVGKDPNPDDAGAARQASQEDVLPADLVVAYDAARYALEEVAARSSESERVHAGTDASYAAAVVQSALAAGSSDTRLAAYAAPAPDPQNSATADEQWAQQVWVRVCEQEIIALGSLDASGRKSALAASADAALRAQSWGADLPTLPGWSTQKADNRESN